MVVSQQPQVIIRFPCPEPFYLPQVIWPQDILAPRNMQKYRARRRLLRKLSLRHRRRKLQVASRQMLQLRMRLDSHLPFRGRFFIYFLSFVDTPTRAPAQRGLLI
ncbi:hypothetical protein MRX96_048400 [Rhipicephalus microplus]